MLLVLGATSWLAYPHIEAWRFLRVAQTIHEGDTRQEAIRKLGIPDKEGLAELSFRDVWIMTWDRPAVFVRIVLDPSGKVEHIYVSDQRSN